MTFTVWPAPPDPALAEADVELVDVAELVADDPELPELELELEPQPASTMSTAGSARMKAGFMDGRLPVRAHRREEMCPSCLRRRRGVT